MNTKHLFDDLSGLLHNKEWVMDASYSVIRNIGARTAGVDGMSRKSFVSDKGNFLNKAFKSYVLELCREWKEMYAAQPVRRVYIPKPDGKKRPLGIPTLGDRIMQKAVLEIIYPIFEADFQPQSYGFRYGRGAQHAIESIARNIQGVYRVFEADFSSYFDTVNHNILMRKIGCRIKDRELNRILREMLKSGIMEEGLTKPSIDGVPQGGIISPTLSNIYLNEFDQWVIKTIGRKNRYIRYADDWVIIFKDEKIKDIPSIKGKLQSKEYRLTLNEEKTHVTPSTDGFEFLGYFFKTKTYQTVMLKRKRDGTKHLARRKRGIVMHPKAKTVKRFKRNVKEITGRSTLNVAPHVTIIRLNLMIRGFWNYYKYCNIYRDFDEIDWYIAKRYSRWLGYKHSKKSFKWLKTKYYLRCNKQARVKLKDDKGKGVLTWSADDGLNRFFLLKLRWNKVSEFTRIPKPKDYPDSLQEKIDKPLRWTYRKAIDTHPSNWQTIRRKTLRRWNGKCAACNGTASDVHRTDLPDAPYLPLCKVCHTNIHKVYKEKNFR